MDPPPKKPLRASRIRKRIEEKQRSRMTKWGKRFLTLSIIWMVLHENSENGESFPNGFYLSQSTIPFPFVLLEFAPVASPLASYSTHAPKGLGNSGREMPLVNGSAMFLVVATQVVLGFFRPKVSRRSAFAINEELCPFEQLVRVKLVVGAAAGRGPTQGVCLSEKDGMVFLSRPNTTVGQRFALELHKSQCGVRSVGEHSLVFKPRAFPHLEGARSV